MNKFAAILCLIASLTGASAQGLINFFNNSVTLVSYGDPPNQAVIKGSHISY
jgi:hypothetical protein